MAAMVLCTLGSLFSCFGNGSEQHGTNIYPMDDGNIVEMYADETVDSFFVVSYDSWEATPYATDGAAIWFSISPNNMNIPEGYYGQRAVVVRTEANHSGISRTGYVKMTTTYENQQLMLPVYQYAWLDITTPQPSFTSNKLQEAKAVFATTLNTTATSALIAFSVHAPATLTSDATWLTIPESQTSFVPGKYAVQMNVEPNNTADDRVAHVTLTSLGISNEVTYTQKGKK